MNIVAFGPGQLGDGHARFTSTAKLQHFANRGPAGLAHAHAKTTDLRLDDGAKLSGKDFDEGFDACANLSFARVRIVARQFQHGQVDLLKSRQVLLHPHAVGRAELQIRVEHAIRAVLKGQVGGKAGRIRQRFHARAGRLI